MRTHFASLAFVLLLMVPASAEAQLQPARLFADGVVLQREAEIPIWGWAGAESEVTVSFDGETHRTTADRSGRWQVTFAPRSAGGPHELMIRSGGDTVHVQNVLVGDVWVASGQSNMEWVVADSKDAEQEIASANDRKIRHFKIPRSWAERPDARLAGGQWHPATPEHVGNFTAVGYFFARSLRQHVDVPIGLVNSTWGGSRIEPWMSAEALGFDSTDAARVLQEESQRVEQMRNSLRKTLGMQGESLPNEDRGMEDDDPRWAAADLNDNEWSTLVVSQTWEEAGYEGLDGVVWYRREVELSAAQADEALTLRLGPVDDNEITWVNGTEVGRTSGWTTPRTYEVPASALQVGTNVIAVRVEDTGGGGGIYGDSTAIQLSGPGVQKSLTGEWKFRVGAVSIDADSRKNQTPTLLYNKMIHPILSQPITGVIWYQGESNASPGDAYEYRTLFQDMITQWRSDWQRVADRPVPFLWVQLANYMEPPEMPSESDWAMLRESQHAALSLPKTGQAVAIDLGEADDIHPRNKQDVGRRLALDARAQAYDQEVVHSGPVYEDHSVKDERVVLSFEHTDGGLTTRNGSTPQGFAIAGSDSTFVWADAKIQGDRVVVWSDEVDTPVAVRYAWADNPVDANLYNGEGLPAAPFRTDEW